MYRLASKLLVPYTERYKAAEQAQIQTLRLELAYVGRNAKTKELRERPHQPTKAEMLRS